MGKVNKNAVSATGGRHHSNENIIEQSASEINHKYVPFLVDAYHLFVINPARSRTVNDQSVIVFFDIQNVIYLLMKILPVNQM